MSNPVSPSVDPALPQTPVSTHGGLPLFCTSILKDQRLVKLTPFMGKHCTILLFNKYDTSKSLWYLPVEKRLYPVNSSLRNQSFAEYNFCMVEKNILFGLGASGEGVRIDSETLNQASKWQTLDAAQRSGTSPSCPIIVTDTGFLQFEGMDLHNPPPTSRPSSEPPLYLDAYPTDRRSSWSTGQFHRISIPITHDLPTRHKAAGVWLGINKSVCIIGGVASGRPAGMSACLNETHIYNTQ